MIKENEDMLHMSQAIEMAKKSLYEGGIPIGSVLVKNKKIISSGHNQRVQKGNQILHGEIDCLSNLGRLDSFKFTTLYSTLMPCYMCAGAIIQFKIPRVVIGESKTFKGAKRLLKSHKIEVIDMDLDICKILMNEFIEKNPEIWNEDIGE